MQCPRCQQDNPPHARFCLACGTRLSPACAACGAEIPAGARFCVHCGRPVTEGAAAPRPPDTYTPRHLAEKILTGRAALEGERKQVTVLFADLKGSMELLADRDPEEARQLLDPVLEQMMEAVHRYEGTVNQVMGDGIMALFGAPLAHEDHAVRACYAALRMQDRVRQYAAQVHRAHGVPIQIRVGVNSGEVVVRSIGSDLHMDYTAVGQTTHVAARLEQMAMPGSVLIAPATHGLAEGYVVAKTLGLRPLRGLPAPIEIHELVGMAGARSRLEAAAARGLARFVGREAELDQLRQALDQAHAGRGQVVAVVGEPGVGKSRLFWQFTDARRREGWRVIQSGSVSYGAATSYLPVVELLRAYFEIGARDEAPAIREMVTSKLLALDRRLESALPALLWLLDAPVDDPGWQRLDPSQRRLQTLDGVRRLLLRESLAGPLILVVEDLHWIDAETQTLLDGLVESVTAARLLLLINYRPEYRHGWSGRACYRQLRMDPLPPERSEELLEGLLGDAPELAPLKRLLGERTDGNPFFLEESVRTLVETRMLAGERGAYRLAGAVDTIQVPATVQAVLAARIDRLPPEEKRLLQSAAVVGHEVPFAILQGAGELSEDELRRGLARLQAAEFVYETQIFPDVTYAFKHALTHEVAYQSLLLSTRQQHHERIAQVIEGRFPAIVETQPDRLARHWTEAGHGDRALGYWWKAGTRAIERSASAEAVAHLSRGLGILDGLPDTPERARTELDFQTALGPALMVTSPGGYGAPEVERAYQRAQVLCEQLGDTPGVVPVLLSLFPVHVGLRVVHLTRGQHLTALEHAEQLLLLAEATRDPGLLLEGHRAMGEVLYYLARFTESRRHLERAIQLDDGLQHRPAPFLAGHSVGHSGVFSRVHLSFTLWMLGSPDQALAASDDALVLARTLSDFPSIAFALYGSLRIHLFRGDAQSVEAQAAALVALTAEQGFPYWLDTGAIFQEWIRAERGTPADGLGRLREAIDRVRQIGMTIGLPLPLALLADLHGRADEHDAGLAVLAEAARLEERGGEADWKAELCRRKGELLLRQPGRDRAQAEACFREALEIARRQEARSWELRAATSLARLLAAKGQHDQARRMVGEPYARFTEGFATADLREAKALLDTLG
jgi:class 3 adenylate cyclase/predicted ATPase